MKTQNTRVGKRISDLLRIVFCAVLIVGTNSGQLQAADETSTWDGSAGNWSDDTKWNTTNFPNNNGITYDAIVNVGIVTDETLLFGCAHFVVRFTLFI